jgi:type I restriction enzyme, R subunit
MARRTTAIDLTASRRYALLKDGVAVSVLDPVHAGQKIERVRVIDWPYTAGSDFLLVSQLSVTGPPCTCWPDMAGFLNGLPWVVIERSMPGKVHQREQRQAAVAQAL